MTNSGIDPVKNNSVSVVRVEPLRSEAFKPFGDIIDASGDIDVVINNGACERFNDRARLDVDDAGRLGVSVFKSRCFSLPLKVPMMERHPLASQAFIPMSSDNFLVVVADDNENAPGELRAFITEPGQGINLLRGTWHGVLTPLGTHGLFAVIDRIGPGENCDIHTFDTPYLVEANP
ncbi:MAG: ureidoglycolate lyase [Gammaproteobacteria bacterium]|nr:ureidoglycolate lyase [Gammaproteobacteria bacterium]